MSHLLGTLIVSKIVKMESFSGVTLESILAWPSSEIVDDDEILERFDPILTLITIRNSGAVAQNLFVELV